jgi:glycolate oxidase
MTITASNLYLRSSKTKGNSVIFATITSPMDIADDLLRIAKGEILEDNWSRKIYSVDASHYEIDPAAIVCPLDEYDVEAICQYSFSKKVPITARGAGTGLLGQSLSSGVILDFTKHMNKIIEIDDDHTTVQPGIVKGELDKEEKQVSSARPGQ